jgi:drug/metabolite transporter (DMT)-like permease
VAVEEREKNILRGAVLVLLSGISYAPVTIAAKVCVEAGLPPVSLNVLRLIIAVSFLGLFALTRVRAGKRLPFPAIAISFIFGSFVWALGGLFYFIALGMIDASLAYLLMYVYPAVVLFISVSLGWERFKFVKAIAALITITGVALVLRVGSGTYGNLIGGVALVMGTTLFYSVYVLIYDRFLIDHSAALVSFFTMFGGLVLITALIPFNGFEVSAIWRDPSLLVTIAITAFGSVGSIIFFLMGIKHIGASWASIISTAQPVLVVLLSWLVLGEVMGPLQMLGALLLVFGVVLIRWEKKPSVKAAT